MADYVIVSAKNIQADSLEAAQQTAKKYKSGNSLVFARDEQPGNILTFFSAWIKQRALGAVAGGIIVLMFATMTMARDKNDWKPLEILQTDSQKIGTAHEGHRFGEKRSIDVEEHVFDAKGIGNLRYRLSSRREVIEPGIYEGALVDGGRKMKVRVDGRREIVLNIESISVAPATIRADGVVMAPAPPTTAEVQRFLPSQKATCLEVLTHRDGLQECWKWSEQPK